ncbi:hypothetical protein GCM10010123_23040 [Pilimelia anulata]|uniref:Uncharacterized protein n=1 Tax=Pilimelia anulata TaxID=53371 RepID=A0A8J3BAQ6_9ACTN|nr:hypothetical protein GCM10010123_23040 [Pilimelia anulata]
MGEVTAGGRARVALGSMGVKDGDRFAVATNADGQYLLTPVVSIPKRELIVWENQELAASLAAGIADVRAGRIGPPLELGDDDADDDLDGE